MDDVSSISESKAESESCFSAFLIVTLTGALVIGFLLFIIWVGATYLPILNYILLGIVAVLFSVIVTSIIGLEVLTIIGDIHETATRKRKAIKV